MNNKEFIVLDRFGIPRFIGTEKKCDRFIDKYDDFAESLELDEWLNKLRHPAKPKDFSKYTDKYGHTTMFASEMMRFEEE